MQGYRGAAGNDTINGVDGVNDRADYFNAPSGIVADLSVVELDGFSRIQDGYGTVDRVQFIDRIRGSAFDDLITGDDADNTFQGLEGNDVLAGLGGDDFLDGGDGRDTADYSAATSNLTVNVAFRDGTASGADIGDDTLQNIEQIFGGSGDDILTNGGGDLSLRGGPGDDRLEGSSVNAAPGSEFNRIDYRDALDSVTIILGDTTNPNIANLNEGIAFSTVSGDAANIGLDTVTNPEFAYGSNFNDIVTVATGFEGRFTGFFEFEGGGGDDQFTYNGPGSGRVGYITALDGVTVDLQAGSARSTNPGDSAGVGIDSFSGVNQVRGSNFNDDLRGRTVDGGDQFRPRGGDDFVDGRGGLNDEVRYSSTDNSVIIDLGIDNQTTAVTTISDGFGGTDTLINVEHLRAGRGDDSLSGDINNNRLRGGDGNDALNGRAGDDTLFGDGGNDLLFGGAGDDRLEGGSGDNTLRGGAGNDDLIGLGEIQTGSDFNSHRLSRRLRRHHNQLRH